MVSFQYFCKATHLHGFYEFSKAHSKKAKVIWFVAIAVALSVTTYLVVNATVEFISEPVRIVIERAKPEEVFYPPMKFCFFHWLQWVNLSKVEELNFTKSELFYAMSYLTDVYSLEVFDIHEVERSVKSKLKSQNMTLKEFYLTIAQRKQVLYEFKNNNYTVEFAALTPEIKNIFNLHHTICYVFPETVMADVIDEAKIYSSNYSSDMGYVTKVDLNLLFRYYENYWPYFTEHIYNKIITYVSEKFGVQPNLMLLPVIFQPNVYSRGVIYSYCGVSGFLVKMKFSVYHKKSSLDYKCLENQKHVAVNFTFFEYYAEKARDFIFEQNNAFEDWIGYSNDIHPKNISFLDEDGHVIQHLTYTRHHKLEKWFETEDKVKQAHDKMFELRNINLPKKVGCEIWDISFETTHRADSSGLSFPVIYPKADQIVVRREVDVQTWSNFVSDIGGLLGIWTGASILTILQVLHLCVGCAREKKRR